jgi:hypothetical protein
VPEYNSGSGTYFKEKYRVIVILFVRVTWSYYYPEVLGISLLETKETAEWTCSGRQCYNKGK